MEDTRAEVIGALLMSVVLACGLLLIRHWEHVRCWLPVPTINSQRQGQSPTPIEGNANE